MAMSIRRQAELASADRTITREEAQALVATATRDGKVTSYEKSQLRVALRQYQDLFAAGAAELLKPLLEAGPTPQPGRAVPLDPTPSQRPVFLGADGRFTLDASGKPPSSPTDRGEALFRAGELVDNARDNLFAHLSPELQAKAFEALGSELTAKASTGGYTEMQALQARASAGAVLLHLMEGSKDAGLAAQMLKAYEGLVLAEPDQRLKENLVFHLSNSTATQTNGAKQVADRLLTTIAPLTPPYEKWFANGNTTVNLSWQVGDEFIANFKRLLTTQGWKEATPGVYEKTFKDPQVGETKFRMAVKLGGSNLLDRMNDPGVHILGYDGHSGWGKNQMSSIRQGPQAAEGGDGKLFLSNLCVGKSQIDAMKEKYPNLQYATTYGSSAVDTDIDGLAKLISRRAGWGEITPFLDRVDGHFDRNNFVTPISTLVREKVLDRDNDGQADYLDKHFNVSTFNVAADTKREFRPVKQDRPSSVLDGTKVNISAQVLNTVSEFNAILVRVNEHSRVVANGWFEPQAGEAEVVKFEKVAGAKGAEPEYRMSVNARYSHMSEEALRATCVYELNRFLQASGEQTLEPVDRKLLAVIGFAQSLDIDDSWRDDEVFGQFLQRYNLPDIDRDTIQRLLDAEHHDYAGSQAMVNSLKKSLSPEALAQLAKPEVGEPVRYV